MHPFVEKLLTYRLIRFGLTGGLASLTHIIIAFTLLLFFATNVFIANLIGFVCAFGLSYLMQSLFVFKKSLSLKNATRFFIVQFSALLIAQLISELFSETNSYLRVLLVVFMIPMVTYVIHRFWTYKETPPSTD
ncbi:polysaccharide synthesis protein GtrA [Enterovibrio norvegicus FF-162]|uniref:Polysaccharide synthesis protein GtrA n=1 Tax=Enterovibrio norvegicus FF-454 TaxID=1185651 RepID=A0A1E5CFV3_9GAMM|nr:GtrA family protein [Enterovibrio norvegicus]OEE64390.1 polysaccharide synthesis protein GtrA [Enterovibrio norvegicus FF-454]OEE74576.1 polysaccharide synthesis protein GtrA [Enterovibrio norvegicus FF-162]